jgi:two-component system OmpR family response regulator
MPDHKTSGKHLHVVEADPVVLQHRVQKLAQDGHKVVASVSGQQALDRLRAEPPPDLIVFTSLPPCIDCLEFRLAQLDDPRLVRVPLLVLTAAGAANVPVGAFCLPQSIDLPALVQAVDQFARPRRPEILVIDDRLDLLHMLETALLYYGFLPHLAQDAPKALEVFQLHRASIDLVLLDVQMAPMDGPQTLAALRLIDPRVTVAFMSGHTGKYTAEQLLTLGAVRVFEKPFKLAKVSEELWQWVEGPIAQASRTSPAGVGHPTQQQQ